MGMSGVMGQVYYVPGVICPTMTCTGWPEPGALDELTCLQDQVTRFVIEDGGNVREYGHDKSRGWQDIVAGTRRFMITLDANWVPKINGDADELLAFGRVMYLVLYPLGAQATCTNPYKGYAMITRCTKTYDQDRGEPISYSCSLSSKGPWEGPGINSNWGGFECDCGA